MFTKVTVVVCGDRYFQKKDEQVDENIEVEEDRPVIYNWWHKKLADYFENTDNVERYIEVITYSWLYCPSDCLNSVDRSHM